MLYEGPLIEDILTQDNVLVEPGLAKAILPEERSSDYYKWTQTGSREYHIALEERIRAPLQNGLLVVMKDDRIKFDDRKLRFSGFCSRGGKTVLQIAPTHFGEIRATDIKAAMNEDYERSLLAQGIRDFNDAGAYFACSVAVNSVPVTIEGHVHVFKRADTQELFPGFYDITGGFVDVGDKIFDLHEGDMTKKFLDLVNYNTRKEFVEEAGHQHNAFELTGLVKGANFVFTHRALLGITSDDFRKRLESAKDASEAKRHLVLKSQEEIARFLELEKNRTSPTAYHALRFHLKRPML